ncbi:cleavage stimulation factor subunit 2 isoform X1 [Etheostoma spectabile]|uniref:cleavage stimulation factor subunit 2 isoform X1 n=1 Tax=Etheostoma spectabile TaxID=54343 RepID=UPI0013AEC001|nr:cleavage stimulation factor subunit 2 isoform X1 [Etheostoma spectabile]XP_032383753.1 cleavage stimulation factor subunit 2 isoform X1 [Etheostoma spectabile]XP_034739013.1 cleavage stimulation factor subunit 2 isoform X1 [Etheostoma cragini]XP_034739014.1 cleavage stimulation factor subunit 2 isoform X1 [Etheostoma cragini]
MANVAAAAAAAAAAAIAANRDPAVDRSLRSVFVGNIPYEATEEQLKDIFSEVGLVVSFRLVYDRETGKPKGYGFCEYQDQETALSAMRNLNGREFSGRALRVDNAASEKNKEELKSLGTGAPIIESPYGDTIQPQEAPESISRAVASLPPEQMFELMKQMKLCVQNSPQEARNMLLQNPQLAYALLQAQVVMRIVDPEIALKMLHRQTPVQPLIPSGQAGGAPPLNPPPAPPSAPVSQPQPVPGMHVNGAPQMMQPPNMGVVPGPMPVPGPGQGPAPVGPPGNLQHSPTGSSGQAAIERSQELQDTRPGGIPPRGLLGDGPNDPRGGTLLNVTGEVIDPNRGYMGAPPPHQAPPVHMAQMASGPPPDMRGPPMDMRGPPMVEPRNMMGDPRGPQMMEPRGPPMETRGRDPRAMDARGPVTAQRVPMAAGMQGPIPHGMAPNAPPPARPGPGISGGPPSGGGFSPGQSQVSTQDQEKAALIMQVLQLTPEQIAMLPPEQRQSILILKEQIQKTAGGER